MGAGLSQMAQGEASTSKLSCRPCIQADPGADTVRSDAAGLDPKDGGIESIDKAAEEEAAEVAEALKKAKEEAELQMRQEAERLEKEEAERVAQELERQEAEKKKQEEIALKAQLAREEQERIAQEKEVARQAAEAISKIEEFLKANGFKGVDAKKKKLMSSNYPLHIAAKERNSAMVELLIKAGADAKQKNSSGQTPRDVAMKANKKGSHDMVLSVLNKAQVPSAPVSHVGGA